MRNTLTDYVHNTYNIVELQMKSIKIKVSITFLLVVALFCTQKNVERESIER